MAIIWAVEHYYYFLMGRKFTIRTDAQGIHFIFKRDRTEPKRHMTRADGWALKLSAYDYDIDFVKGHYNIADPPSRLGCETATKYVEGEGPCEIATIACDPTDLEFETKTVTLESVKEQTVLDDELQAVLTALESDVWPSNIKAYEKIKHELWTTDGIVVKGGAIILPVILRHDALDAAHEGHPGISATKSILRSRVWWPHMNKDAEEKVKRCGDCMLTGRKDPPAPMLRTPMPEEAWESLAVDFSGPHEKYGGVHILVTIDSASRYMSASVIKGTTFLSVSKVLDKLFARFGYPKTVKSDNGPPFGGQEYAQYFEARGIKANFSVPRYAQSNGQVEAYMKLVNRAMEVASANSSSYLEELAKRIRAHNSAINRMTGVSPDEMMFGRKLRRSLPLIGMSRVDLNMDRIRDRDAREKQKAKVREDAKRGARVPQHKVGDKVVAWRHIKAKDDPRFDPTRYTVIKAYGANYDLMGPDGRIMKRNAIDIKSAEGVSAPEEPEIEVGMQAQGEQGQADTAIEAPQPRRTNRVTRPPKHLQMYVRFLEENK